ncbi:hypothetical protein AAF712_011984 [Marasmius tenuissimus]|uniref:Uncharacterized protein n=1 Tax=Marasmius tenuissimus TaxID=585030 RepID=A0ABR2ZIQ9_9AGAR
MPSSHSPDCVDNTCLEVFASNLAFDDPNIGIDIPWFHCPIQRDAVLFRLTLKIHPDLVEDLDDARKCSQASVVTHAVSIQATEQRVSFVRSNQGVDCGCSITDHIFQVDHMLSRCILHGLKCWEAVQEENNTRESLHLTLQVDDRTYLSSSTAKKISPPDPTHYKVNRRMSLRRWAEIIQAEEEEGKRQYEPGQRDNRKRVNPFEEPEELAALRTGEGMLTEEDGEWAVVRCDGKAFTGDRRVRPKRKRI